MKIRWREHETIFVTVLAVGETIRLLANRYNPSFEQTIAFFTARFNDNGFPFNVWSNMLLPQAGAILLVYLCYLSINGLIVPAIKKISFADVEKLLAVNVLRPVGLVVVTAYFLAIGVNILSYYAKPHLFNYGHYQLLALLGYNDQPLSNLFAGLARATGLILLFTALAGVRELGIWLMDKPGPKRAFRVLVINNTTPLLLVYLLVPVFTNPLHTAYLDYLAWSTPVLALYIYLTFWLFPLREKYSWQQKPVLFRLLPATFAGAGFFAVVFPGRHWLAALLLYWLFLLLVVTPLTWLLYRQRKDRIVQLKGLETALAKSTSDLQFLRSQINPHFLFNALNTLYGTALMEKSEQTAEGIQMLGDMMRFMLHENNQDFIPLHKEIAYLKSYIALQKLRTPPSSHILIKDHIGDACNRQIAPMLLIPLVENAFKHGISLKENSWIDIRFECAETGLCLEVRNSVHNRSAGDTEKDRSGIGLKNVAARLQLLYPGKHVLETGSNGNEFIARLQIQ
jgi:hypothetical protein